MNWAGLDSGVQLNADSHYKRPDNVHQLYKHERFYFKWIYVPCCRSTTRPPR